MGMRRCYPNANEAPTQTTFLESSIYITISLKLCQHFHTYFYLTDCSLQHFFIGRRGHCLVVKTMPWRLLRHKGMVPGGPNSFRRRTKSEPHHPPVRIGGIVNDPALKKESLRKIICPMPIRLWRTGDREWDYLSPVYPPMAERDGTKKSMKWIGILALPCRKPSGCSKVGIVLTVRVSSIS